MDALNRMVAIAGCQEAVTRFLTALDAGRLDQVAAAMANDGIWQRQGVAHLSGLVLVNSRSCLHHAICHAIGAVTGAAHGDANSVILPHAMRFSYEVAAASMAVGQVEALQAELEVPARLRDIGVPREMLGAIARKVMGERGLYFNPRPVAHPDEIEALLQAAW